MSQVIVTNDNLRDRRSASRLQEQKINRDVIRESWKKSVLPAHDPIAMVAGVVGAPIALFWGIIVAFLGLSLGIVLWVFKGLAKLIGRA